MHFQPKQEHSRVWLYFFLAFFVHALFPDLYRDFVDPERWNNNEVELSNNNKSIFPVSCAKQKNKF